MHKVHKTDFVPSGVFTHDSTKTVADWRSSTPTCWKCGRPHTGGCRVKKAAAGQPVVNAFDRHHSPMNDEALLASARWLVKQHRRHHPSSA